MRGMLRLQRPQGAAKRGLHVASPPPHWRTPVGEGEHPGAPPLDVRRPETGTPFLAPPGPRRALAPAGPPFAAVGAASFAGVYLQVSLMKLTSVMFYSIFVYAIIGVALLGQPRSKGAAAAHESPLLRSSQQTASALPI